MGGTRRKEAEGKGGGWNFSKWANRMSNRVSLVVECQTNRQARESSNILFQLPTSFGHEDRTTRICSPRSSSSSGSTEISAGSEVRKVDDIDVLPGKDRSKAPHGVCSAVASFLTRLFLQSTEKGCEGHPKKNNAFPFPK